MPDATPNPLPDGVLPSGVEKARPEVNVTDLHPSLVAFLVPLGLVHLHLFDLPVVITAGRDGLHSPGSKHHSGDAVDLRVKDLPDKWRAAHLLVLSTLSDRFGLTVFDESNLPGQPHIHVEVAG
jgi:hypothetical protein